MTQVKNEGRPTWQDLGGLRQDHEGVIYELQSEVAAVHRAEGQAAHHEVALSEALRERRAVT